MKQNSSSAHAETSWTQRENFKLSTPEMDWILLFKHQNSHNKMYNQTKRFSGKTLLMPWTKNKVHPLSKKKSSCDNFKHSARHRGLSNNYAMFKRIYHYYNSQQSEALMFELQDTLVCTSAGISSTAKKTVEESLIKFFYASPNPSEHSWIASKSIWRSLSYVS